MEHERPRRDRRNGEVVSGTYVLHEALGQGGMGIVYAAKRDSGDSVAIKLLHPDHAIDEQSRRRLHNEAIAARFVAHPNVVSVIDFSAADAATPFVVMERVHGIPLGTVIRRYGMLPLRRATRIARQILAGLEATHAAGVVHADIKSENILLARDRDGVETVKIIDFGLATIYRVDHPALEPEHDARGDVLMSGTPEYMAPEVIRGDRAVPASDLYAVGVIVYEMITGKTPFGDGSSAAILESHLRDPVVPPSLRQPDRLIPLALERAVMRALEKDVLDRYSSAAAFSAALAASTPSVEPEPSRSVDAESTPTAYSAEAPTHDFVARATSRSPSRSRRRSTERLRRLRDKRSAAIGRGAIDEAIVATLEISRKLVDEHRLWSAVRELEDSIDALTRSGAVVDGLSSLWRLWLTLAALYHGLGEPRRARRAAAIAHHQATSVVGRDRATALLRRLPR